MLLLESKVTWCNTLSGSWLLVSLESFAQQHHDELVGARASGARNISHFLVGAAAKVDWQQVFKNDMS